VARSDGGISEISQENSRMGTRRVSRRATNFKIKIITNNKKSMPDKGRYREVTR